MGIFAAAADITLGTLAATVNTIPEISRNHPTFAKYVNYAALIYGVSRLGYEAYKSIKIEKLSLQEIQNEIGLAENIGTGGNINFIKIISRNMAKQEEEMSCAAACIHQFAKIKG